ncbi:branched-chain amino acid ABC transporter permease [Loktanella sp. S4079]|uniref:branched-chain amino acid ABC transporter permease n=1 Tax=Loktanella sp. S4079 TaxID=579483 RepID=UPI00061F246F|nr:branched-chain amino acid ABC transporter permease [Loktanella sp. S4079]KJZ18440.1 ABC transporter permease [Loktanella sp. S4079]
MTDTTPQMTDTGPMGLRLKSAMPWLCAALLLLILPQIFSANATITLMNQMAITIIFALAYNMLLGQGGMLSFGHAVFMGLGGVFAVHVMSYVEAFGAPLPLPLLPLFGGFAGLLLACVIGSFSTRQAGTVFAMISLGVGELIAACSLIFVTFFGGETGVSADRTYGLPVFGVEFLRQSEVYYLIAAWLLLSVFLMYLYTRTPMGRMANAVRDNPERAEFLGYSARWVRFYSFIFSGFFAGIAGGLFALNYEIMTSESMSLVQSGKILLITFLGGMGYFVGPIIGAIVFTLLTTVLGRYTELSALYVGTVFVLTVMYCPRGLAGLLMMHEPAYRLGKLRRLVAPYLKVLIPVLVATLGCAALFEMLFHVRHAPPGDHEMRLYWVTFDSHSPIAWGIVIGVTLLAIMTTRALIPHIKDAWHDANTIDKGAS